MPEIAPGSGDYWHLVEEIFHAALDLPAEERPAFLRARSGGERVEREVRELLHSFEAQERLGAAGPADPYAGRRYGPYEVVRKIGAGGMGEVYLAQRREDFERQVAIKVIGNSLLATPLLIERFRQERQILATLDHPNIARLLDGGVTSSGQPYLAMEYIEGVRLDRYCADRGLTIEARLALFCKVCAAVEYAHGKLIVHRDLKPNNILVNERGEPKLLDFGVAKVLEPEESGAGDTLTMTGAVLATPRYASPERLAGAPATVASDVYSLGVILYELLTGQPPYAGADSSPAKLIGAMMTRELPPPSTVGPETLRRRLRGGLDGIAAHALAKRPEDRYASVAQLTAAIERYRPGSGAARGKHLLVPAGAVAFIVILTFLAWRGLAPGVPDPPPLSLAVLPVAVAPSAADLQEFRGPITEKLNGALLRTWGVSLLEWQEMAAFQGPDALRRARAKLAAALILETAIERKDGALLARMTLRRRKDGGVAWAGTFPFKMDDPRHLNAAVDALAAVSIQPVLETEANYLANARSVEPRGAAAPLNGVTAPADPCSRMPPYLATLFAREIPFTSGARANEARSFDTRVPYRLGPRQYPADTAPLVVKSGTPVPLRAPALVQLEADTCVLTSYDGTLPVYPGGCVVPQAPSAYLELNYVCAAKAYPIDMGNFANDQGLEKAAMAPAGARMLNGIPFLLPDGQNRFWRGQTAAEGSARPVSVRIPVGRAGVSTAYFLLNTEWGQPGPLSYLALEFRGDHGAYFERKLVGGVDVRDYHHGVFTDTVNGTRTRVAFDDGLGQRMDLVAVALPEAFRRQTLVSVTVVDTGRLVFQRAILWAVTVR